VRSAERRDAHLPLRLSHAHLSDSIALAKSSRLPNKGT
jgi:hypothetical protein